METITKQIEQVAEVAGYLWQKGWAERNGGNIVINVTDQLNSQLSTPNNSQLSTLNSKLSDPIPIGTTLPHLKGCYFFCKGTNRRMRDLARWPMDNGSIIRILDDCAHYVIVADKPVMPTSELPSHLSVHNYLISKGSPYKASLHTHPIELVAMTHHRPFLEKDVLTKILWSMIPETRAFCPKGLGIVPYLLPSSLALGEATLKTLDEGYDVVMWEKHGVFAVDTDIMSAFDQVDVLNKAAQIYMSARSMGFEPEGMSEAQMQELAETFGLGK
jgi:rhamnulose-1-phosphate aldolase